MKSMKIVMGLFVCVALVGGFAGLSRAEDFATKVKASMEMLKAKTSELGEAKLAEGTLSFGDTEMNGNYDVVDEIAEANGCTATIFALKDGGYQRISTNVIKEGNRAVGTMLADASPAMAPIKAGQAFYGPAEILGAQYETGYEPIKNAAGDVIGIYYVGYKL